jgi:hypothetical protein
VIISHVKNATSLKYRLKANFVLNMMRLEGNSGLVENEESLLSVNGSVVEVCVNEIKVEYSCPK